VRIDVCIATFMRAALLERLLGDLQSQELPDGVTARIIVVDNDARESARPVVAGFEGSRIPVEYVTQPEQNIALTRNRALDHSSGDLIAFIDDDESACTDWLATMLTAMQRYEADVVFGPVTGLVPTDAPRWIVDGKFFERPAMPTGTRVQMGAAGNVLLKASAVRGKIAFDRNFGLSGSEDTDFFHRLSRTGAVMVWCQEALLTEHVPPQRLTLRWLVRRAFRGGQGHVDALGRPRGFLGISEWLATRASLLLARSLVAMCAVPFSRATAARYALKAVTNVGQLSTIVGYRLQAYHRPKR
jgi:succinoglycan biosynthesis protein ExoM